MDIMLCLSEGCHSGSTVPTLQPDLRYSNCNKFWDFPMFHVGTQNIAPRNNILGHKKILYRKKKRVQKFITVEAPCLVPWCKQPVLYAQDWSECLVRGHSAYVSGSQTFAADPKRNSDSPSSSHVGTETWTLSGRHAENKYLTGNFGTSNSLPIGAASTRNRHIRR